ncbi:MAG: hypothetical protein QG658_235 [Patescibacteria group bacterium]|jgi:hypothetical protein|nr:hypothetical protein [Patescibacteria group bacterium]
MAKPSGSNRPEFKVKGPNGPMRGLHQKLSARFGRGSVVVQISGRSECRVVVKNADVDEVRHYLAGMGLSMI